MKPKAIVGLLFACTLSFATFAAYVSLENADKPTFLFASLEAFISLVGFLLSTQLNESSK